MTRVIAWVIFLAVCVVAWRFAAAWDNPFNVSVPDIKAPLSAVVPPASVEALRIPGCADKPECGTW